MTTDDRGKLTAIRDGFLREIQKDWPVKEADKKWESYERSNPPTLAQRSYAFQLARNLESRWLDDVVITGRLAELVVTIRDCDDIGQMSKMIDKLKHLNNLRGTYGYR